MRTTLLLAALALLPAVAFAQDVDLLFSARTLTCEWGQGTTANWNDGGQPTLKQVSLGLGEQWNRKYGRRLDLGPPE